MLATESGSFLTNPRSFPTGISKGLPLGDPRFCNTDTPNPHYTVQLYDLYIPIKD